MWQGGRWSSSSTSGCSDSTCCSMHSRTPSAFCASRFLRRSWELTSRSAFLPPRASTSQSRQSWCEWKQACTHTYKHKTDFVHFSMNIVLPDSICPQTVTSLCIYPQTILFLCIHPQTVASLSRALRRGGIPVVHLYDEAVPGQFTLPSDQQTHNVTTSEKTWVLTLKSPAPGSVYLLASVMNPVEDVVQAVSGSSAGPQSHYPSWTHDSSGCS